MLKKSVSKVFANRRKKLAEQYPDAAFILPTGHEIIRNDDVHYPFRPETNFYYLTGFDEAEAVLVLTAKKSVLFVMTRDPEREMWEGERYGIDGTKQVFGVDEAYLVSDLDTQLPELLKGVDRVFYRMGRDEPFDRRILQALESARVRQGRSGRPISSLVDPKQPLGEMRLFKTTEEIELMKKSCSITAQAHRTVMKAVKPGMNEYEIEALIDYEFRRHGCKRLGYGSIVAGGKNAACLHYRSNNESLRDGELLLIDAGGEYEMFSADITRTFPIGERFTDAQAKLYDLVLKSQKNAIDMIRPGRTLPELHAHATEVLVDGMLSLGLMKGTPQEIIARAEHRRFYPHNTSHWLGHDVHDAGLYFVNGEPRKLEPGMVFTVEPGFYVQPTDSGVPAEFRNIGIRIEDDVLVTQTGCDVMTHEAPKERSEIEALRA